MKTKVLVAALMTAVAIPAFAEPHHPRPPIFHKHHPKPPVHHHHDRPHHHPHFHHPDARR